MSIDMTYEFATRNADHLKALGRGTVYLNDKTQLPWHLVTEVDDVGSITGSLPSSVRFEAHDPETGLNFYWSFDIVDDSTRGRWPASFKVAEIQSALAAMPEEHRKDFRKVLAEIGDKCREEGMKLWDSWNRCMANATAMDFLVSVTNEKATQEG